MSIFEFLNGLTLNFTDCHSHLHVCGLTDKLKRFQFS